MTDSDGFLTRIKQLPAARAAGRWELERRIRNDQERGIKVPKRAAAWALSGVALWQRIPEDEAERLRAAMRVRRYARRESALLSDDQGLVWIVLEGGMKLCRIGALDRRLVEALLVPGDVFGRLTAPGEGDDYEVQALEPSSIGSIPREDLSALFTRHPALGLTVIQELEGKQRKLVRRLEALAVKDVRARVAESLLALATEHGEPCSHGFAVDLRITQQDLAELVGASRQMVNRVLGELSRQFYVQRMGRVICVLDRDRLDKYVEALGVHASPSPRDANEAW